MPNDTLYFYRITLVVLPVILHFDLRRRPVMATRIGGSVVGEGVFMAM